MSNAYVLAMIVYRYGLRRPTENLDVVLAQMRAADRYYNTLVEIENGRRDAFAVRANSNPHGEMAAGLHDLDAEYAAIELQVESIVEQIKDERVRRRGRVVPQPMTDALRQAKQDRAVLGALRAHARRLASVNVSDEERKRMQECVTELMKNAREYREAGMLHGTYLLVERAFDLARQTTTFPRHIRFRRWDGGGTVGCQVQWQKQRGDPAPTTDKIFDGTSLHLRVDPVPVDAWNRSTRASKSGRDKRMRTRLHVRVGTDENRKPIWAVVPMLMHRPLGPGVIKWATISRRMIGPREEWYATITVDNGVPATTAATGGAVALHVGWIRRQDATAVGNWMDEYGRAGRVLVPDTLDSRLEKVRDIQSIRSKNFDAARDSLAAWIRSISAESNPRLVREVKLPAWLRDASEFLLRWRSQGRLVRLIRQWRDNRFDDDDAAYAAAEAWRYHDHHLWEWERSQQIKAERYRKNEYRRAAARLARTYSTLVLDKWNITDVVKRTDIDRTGGIAPVDGFEKTDATDERRKRASPSDLREAFVNAFRREGAKIVEIDSRKESITCPDCGAADAAHRLGRDNMFACSRCGFEHDIDTIALLNTLARAGVDMRKTIERMKKPTAAE
jgi:predicted RNA-binding Zn-ribbon protein involved in translation (DUF1610 family)